MKLPRRKITSKLNPRNLYAIPSEGSVKRFKEQVRHLTRRKALVTLAEMVNELNPVIQGWGMYYCEAHVRKLFKKLDGWIQRRLYRVEGNVTAPKQRGCILNSTSL